MKLSGKKLALLATNGFEDSELTHPMEAVKGAGADVIVISEKMGEITGKNDTKISVDKTVDDVAASDFDGLLLPGGVQNPDTMRQNEIAVNFVRDFFSQHKPVAAICHAPWLLVEADVVRGRKVTSWPSLKTDLTNAGADWVDEEVVVDQRLVTSRKPADLDIFCRKVIEEFAGGQVELERD
jgi:deglycase